MIVAQDEVEHLPNHGVDHLKDANGQPCRSRWHAPKKRDRLRSSVAATKTETTFTAASFVKDVKEYGTLAGINNGGRAILRAWKFRY